MTLESLQSTLDSEGAEADAVWERDFDEEQPTAIDPRRHLHYVEVSEDGFVATFVGRGDYTDVGVSEPLPSLILLLLVFLVSCICIQTRMWQNLRIFGLWKIRFLAFVVAPRDSGRTGQPSMSAQLRYCILRSYDIRGFSSQAFDLCGSRSSFRSAEQASRTGAQVRSISPSPPYPALGFPTFAALHYWVCFLGSFHATFRAGLLAIVLKTAGNIAARRVQRRACQTL